MWADDEQQSSDSNENGLNPDNFEYHFVASYDSVKGTFLNIYGDAAEAAKELNLSVRDVDSASTTGEIFAGVRWKYVSDTAAYELFRTKAQKEELVEVAAEVIYVESDSDSVECVKKSEENLSTKKSRHLKSSDGATVRGGDLSSTVSSKHFTSSTAKSVLHDTTSSAVGTSSEEEIVEDNIYWCDSPEEHDVAITQEGGNSILKDSAKMSLIVLENEKKKSSGVVRNTSPSALESGGTKGKGQNKKQNTKEIDHNRDITISKDDKQATTTKASVVKISSNSATVSDSTKITAVTSKEPSMDHILDTSQLSFAFFGPSPKGKDYGPHFISREKPYFLRNALGFRLIVEAVQVGVRTCLYVCQPCLPGLPDVSL